MTSSRRAARLALALALSTAPLLRAAEPAAPASAAPTAPAAPVAGATSSTSGSSIAGLNPGEGRAVSRDPVEVAADALVVRPVGIAATAVGAAIFVVALPFAAISGDVNRTGRALVGAPARFTFKRRLGDFGGTAPL